MSATAFLEGREPASERSQIENRYPDWRRPEIAVVVAEQRALQPTGCKLLSGHDRDRVAARDRRELALRLQAGRQDGGEYGRDADATRATGYCHLQEFIAALTASGKE